MSILGKLDPNPTWIATEHDLAAACARWRTGEVVGLDTEFVRERTYFPALGLIQVAAGPPAAPEVALIDAVALDGLEPLADLLTDSTVTKAVHAGGEDMMVFQHRLGVLPTPLFDTQIAAAMTGLGHALGYSALVETLYGVHLPKGEQRTNWLRRPLSTEQIRYAARDTVYLPALFEGLSTELEQRDRSCWIAEDATRLADLDRLMPAPEDTWRKVKGGGRVSGAQGQGVLEALAAWRERKARSRDLPRGFVLPDAALVALAQRRPRSAVDLQSVGEIPDPARRRYARELLQVVREAPVSEHVHPPRPAYDPRPLVRKLQQAVAARAEKLGVPSELLANRRTLESILRRVDREADELLPAALRGWRAEAVGEELVTLARELLDGV